MKNVYFPQAFRASRPYYSSALVKRMMEASARGGFAASNEVMFTAITDAATRLGRERQSLLVDNFLSFEAMAMQSFAQLDVDGTPLYDIDPVLLEALAQSDPGEMQLADIRTVNLCYYLHWGPQPDLLLHGTLPVEGAAVFTMNGGWRIGLVGRSGKPWLHDSVRDTFFLRFPPETVNLPFAEAVDVAIAADQAEFVQTFAQSNLSLTSAVAAATASLRSSSGAARSAAEEELRKRKGILERQAASFDVVKQDHERNVDVIKRALMLAGNCMSYLTAYPEDSRTGWQPDTPEAMLTKVARGGKEGARTLSKLQSLGFLQVHRVGLDFHRLAQEHAPADRAVDGHSAARPHWRRGHWRHQAHGPQMSLRKLLWIQPQRVVGAAWEAQP